MRWGALNRRVIGFEAIVFGIPGTLVFGSVAFMMFFGLIPMVVIPDSMWAPTFGMFVASAIGFAAIVSYWLLLAHFNHWRQTSTGEHRGATLLLIGGCASTIYTLSLGVLEGPLLWLCFLILASALHLLAAVLFGGDRPGET